jgi:hypothetical protein
MPELREARMKRQRVGRRTFLAGLLTGGGVAAGLGAAASKAASLKAETAKPAASPHPTVLYRRTEETERYYRSLYR